MAYYAVINGHAEGQFGFPTNRRVLNCSTQLVWADNNSAKIAMPILAMVSSSGHYRPEACVGKILMLAFCHSGTPLHLITRQVPIHTNSCTFYRSVCHQMSRCDRGLHFGKNNYPLQKTLMLPFKFQM